MVGDTDRRPALGRAQVVAPYELGNVARKLGDAGSARGIFRLALQQVAVVLDHGAATRRVDDDGVDRTFGELLRPGVNVALGVGDGGSLVAQVVGERAAAAGAGRYHDVDAAPGEQPYGGVVDAGPQHLLRAAGKQDHARAPLRPRGGCAGALEARGRRQHGGRQLDHGGELLQAEPAQERDPWARQGGKSDREAEALGPRQHLSE